MGNDPEEKMMYSPQKILDKQIDITGPDIVEISIKEDGKVIWINVDGICACRICRIKELIIDDRRKK